MIEVLKYETIYRFTYDFKSEKDLDIARTMFHGLGFHWYKVQKIEVA